MARYSGQHGWAKQPKTGRPTGDALLAAQEQSRIAREDEARRAAREASRAEHLAVADESLAIVHDALLAVGATLEAESPSGSRYYRLPDGTPVRVADHEATDATDQWLDREDGRQILVDRRTWRSALSQVTSPSAT